MQYSYMLVNPLSNLYANVLIKPILTAGYNATESRTAWSWWNSASNTCNTSWTAFNIRGDNKTSLFTKVVAVVIVVVAVAVEQVQALSD